MLDEIRKDLDGCKPNIIPWISLNMIVDKLEEHHRRLCRIEIHLAIEPPRKEPKPPLDPKDWEPGDVVECENGIEGIFHHFDTIDCPKGYGEVFAYWQDENGKFQNRLSSLGLNTCYIHFKFRPDKPDC